MEYLSSEDVEREYRRFKRPQRESNKQPETPASLRRKLTGRAIELLPSGAHYNIDTKTGTTRGPGTARKIVGAVEYHRLGRDGVGATQGHIYDPTDVLERPETIPWHWATSGDQKTYLLVEDSKGRREVLLKKHHVVRTKGKRQPYKLLEKVKLP